MAIRDEVNPDFGKGEFIIYAMIWIIVLVLYAVIVFVHLQTVEWFDNPSETPGTADSDM